MATSIEVPAGIRVVRDAVLVLGRVALGVVAGGGVVSADGGVSSTGNGLSALIDVVSVIDISVSLCCFWQAETPIANASASVGTA
jgi:hypothetical protein